MWTYFDLGFTLFKKQTPDRNLGLSVKTFLISFTICSRKNIEEFRITPNLTLLKGKSLHKSKCCLGFSTLGKP